MAEEVQEVTEESPKNSAMRKNIIMLGVLLLLMIGEGVGVFILAKAWVAPNPKEALAANTPDGLNPDEGQREWKDVEIKVADFGAQNERSQRMMIYRFVVYSVVSEKHATEFSEKVERHKAKIEDRFTRVVRGLDPQRFSEPDLPTLRSQFKHELSQIVGEEIEVKEVLLPSVEAYSEG